MNTISSVFIRWYFNDFARSWLYEAMAGCSEASPYHREHTVAAHTNMVVSEYMSQLGPDWNHDDLLGAFACAFHDVGKPKARTEKHNEARGTYYSYGGHEIISARMWEDWAVNNWTFLENDFGFSAEDLYKVTWMVEHHRPWGLKDSRKRQNLYTTASLAVDISTYTGVLRADNWGRIGDAEEANHESVSSWIREFTSLGGINIHEWTGGAIPARRRKTSIADGSTLGEQTLYVLIGASGVGKSTFSQDVGEDVIVYSWDQLRHDLYDTDDYSRAFELSTKDKSFMSKVNTAYVDALKTGRSVVVDNTNTSAKRRRFFIDEARRKGLHTVGVVFPAALSQVRERQRTRTDKTVPDAAVTSQYMNTQQPQLGEFDEIIVAHGNL